MEINVISNDIPISQLPKFAKIFDRRISKQLTNNLNNNSFFYKYQSGYRKLYRTTVCYRQPHNIDNNTHTQVILLDLSSAFDTTTLYF